MAANPDEMEPSGSSSRDIRISRTVDIFGNLLKMNEQLYSFQYLSKTFCIEIQNNIPGAINQIAMIRERSNRSLEILEDFTMDAENVCPQEHWIRRDYDEYKQLKKKIHFELKDISERLREQPQNNIPEFEGVLNELKEDLFRLQMLIIKNIIHKLSL